MNKQWSNMQWQDDLRHFADLLVEKPYYLQKKTEYRLSLGISYLFSTLSVLTAFVFAADFTSKLIPESWISIEVRLGGAGIICFVLLYALELFKRNLWSEVFEAALKKSKLPFLAGLLAIALLSMSVYLSVKGVELFTRTSMDKEEVLTADYISQKSAIDQEFEKLIQKEQEDLAAYKASVSYRGKINIHNPTTRNVIEGHTRRIATLRNDWKLRQQELKDSHQQALTKNTVSTENTALKMMVFSFSVEILIAVLLYFIMYYRYRCLKESGFDPTRSLQLSNQIQPEEPSPTDGPGRKRYPKPEQENTGNVIAMRSRNDTATVNASTVGAQSPVLTGEVYSLAAEEKVLTPEVNPLTAEKKVLTGSGNSLFQVHRNNTPPIEQKDTPAEESELTSFYWKERTKLCEEIMDIEKRNLKVTNVALAKKYKCCESTIRNVRRAILEVPVNSSRQQMKINF
ncbi:hypothetical protein V6R21_25070 [Limibacter armeniacum]|uniref:hypothetical protein n=1 Tax=Limibacter armeniacum TaxID=466084 RepID=UPI002FE53A25